MPDLTAAHPPKSARRPGAAKAAPDDAAPGAREVAVPAVVRAAAMLRLLSNAILPLGVNQIARDLNIIPSTCLHILRALANEGLVTADPATKRYRLGPQILTLAKAALRDSISAQAQPHLDDIAGTYPVTALAVSLSAPDHYVVVAKSQFPRAFNLAVELGSRFPALISATGRCVAAYSSLPPRLLKTKFERLRWHRAPGYDAWLAEVAAVKTRGYAIDDGHYINGVTIIAAPILGPRNDFRHAIVAICIREGWSEPQLQELADMLRASANQVAERLSVNTRVK